MKTLYIISGCNGAGKTTASMAILPQVLQVREFVNADNIAKGLSPLNPESVGVAAGRLMLHRIRQLLEGEESFAIETTLATRHYVQLAQTAQARGFRVELIFFWLQTPAVAIKRVAQRVAEGGHNIATEVVIRRYHAGIRNLFNLFMPVVDDWMLYNNSDMEKILVATGGKHQQTQIFQPQTYEEIKAYAI
ncbi:MAG: zeta toxin family protein [Paludibacteraceae bacterium]|nr:zeta toxin family protein [Paludibacteraceae bacterium]MBR1480642.1 zeta toxin family protein [Paludibacteraceae bacterium]